MARRTLMQQVARWHIWLGWAVALPLVLWTASGLFMAARPIEEVRGEHLRAGAAPVDPAGLVLPRSSGPISELSLLDEGGQPVWVVTGSDMLPHRFAARSGDPLGPVDKIEAERLANAAYAGTAALTGMQRFTAEQSPIDLRRARPAWQASFADGTHVYLDADSGEVLALRTRFWRAYDFMWALHIMNFEDRESAHHPLVWIAGALALLASLFGTVLLFRRRSALKR